MYVGVPTGICYHRVFLQEPSILCLLINLFDFTQRCFLRIINSILSFCVICSMLFAMNFCRAMS